MEKVGELERENSSLQKEIVDSELKHQKIYLHMYLKGIQAAKLDLDPNVSLIFSVLLPFFTFILLIIFFDLVKLLSVE